MSVLLAEEVLQPVPRPEVAVGGPLACHRSGIDPNHRAAARRGANRNAIESERNSIETVGNESQSIGNAMRDAIETVEKEFETIGNAIKYAIEAS